MRYITEWLGVVGRGSLLLAALLLGGCFYSPSMTIASPQPNPTSEALLSQQRYDQSSNAAPSAAEEKTRASSEKQTKSSVAQTKTNSPEPDTANAWAAENQANIVDDAALRKKLVICDGCTSKPTPRQKRETVEQAGSSAGWDDDTR